MLHSGTALQVFRLVVLACVLQMATAKLADYVTPCRIKDENLEECIVQQAAILQPALIKGIKEFGLPSLDPLRIPLMQIDEGSAGSVGISINISDSRHYGWETNKLIKVKADPTNQKYEMYFTNPNYSILGDYQIKGRILVLPITGSGGCNMTLENVNTVVIMSGKLEKRGEETYLALTKVKSTFVSSKIHVRFDNLFGNKQLSDAMNDFLNQNSNEAFMELKPAIDEVFSEIIASFLGRFFSKVPYNQLFKLD